MSVHSPILKVTECGSGELTATITDQLDIFEQLACAQVCKALHVDWTNRASLGALCVAKDERVTDGFLLWLLRRFPGEVRFLEVSECPRLTRAGITKAIAGGKTDSMTELHCLSIGGASWSVEELRRLVQVCPSIKVLHADCRAKGFDAGQLDLFVGDKMDLHPRKLVLHRPAPPQSEEVEDPAAPAPTAEESETPLGAALHRCRESLIEIDARAAEFDSDAVTTVAQLVGTSGATLRRLLMPGSRVISDSAMSLLARAIARSERLQELQLACSSINTNRAKSLATALTENSSLRQLELQHNPILDAGGSALGLALGTNRSLQSLSLTFTGLGDRTCGAMAYALRHGSALETLDLAGNRLTAEGVIELSEALPLGRLRRLGLSANAGIGARGATAVAAALPKCSLTSLEMEGCEIGASPCGRLAAALTESSVSHINLSANHIGDIGAWELAWRMPECASLRELFLAVNEIEEDGGGELLAGLRASVHVQTLDLRGNFLSKERAQGLEATGRANVAFQRVIPSWWSSQEAV